jgi:hypothetical protein
VADVTPNTWLSGVTSDATAHTITFKTGSAPSSKTLPQLLDAAANPSSGDIRQIILAFCEAIYQANRTQILADNKIVQMNISRSGNPDFDSGGFFMQYTISAIFTEVGTWTMKPE